MNTFFDEKEEEAVEAWNAGLLRDDDDSHLIAVVMNGFAACPDDCLSREVYGDSCRCIRAVFSCPDEYKLYLELRQLKNAAQMLAALLEKER